MTTPGETLVCSSVGGRCWGSQPPVTEKNRAVCGCSTEGDAMVLGWCKEVKRHITDIDHWLIIDWSLIDHWCHSLKWSSHVVLHFATFIILSPGFSTAENPPCSYGKPFHPVHGNPGNRRLKSQRATVDGRRHSGGHWDLLQTSAATWPDGGMNQRFLKGPRLGIIYGLIHQEKVTIRYN